MEAMILIKDMQRIRILYHESQGANDPDIHIGYDMHRVSEPDRKETEYAEGSKKRNGKLPR